MLTIEFDNNCLLQFENLNSYEISNTAKGTQVKIKGEYKRWSSAYEIIKGLYEISTSFNFIYIPMKYVNRILIDSKVDFKRGV